MSYRLRKLWEKDPKAAAKECSIYITLMALMVLLGLSDGFCTFPPVWQILLVLLVYVLLILAVFGYVKYLQKNNKSTKPNE